MNNHHAFQKTRDFLVCIDSDGCMFDTMELKHKECFCPAYIEHFALQPISRYAREAWEFSNLYSYERGIHRLRSLLRSMDLLRVRKAVLERGFAVPTLTNLRTYVLSGGKLSNDALRQYVLEHPEAKDIQTTIEWSEDVNARVARMVHGVPPFPHARDSLQMLRQYADIAVVSATPTAAITSEWSEHGLTPYVTALCGQEMGSKQEIISRLQKEYPLGNTLMIGDALGDMQAAHAANALFYPIRPGEEGESWAELPETAEQFFLHIYSGQAETDKISCFERLLPKTPPWEAQT